MSRRGGSSVGWLSAVLVSAALAPGGAAQHRSAEPDVESPPALQAPAASDPDAVTGRLRSDPGSVVELTLDDALATALAANPRLEVERLAPEIQGTVVDEAWAAFDPWLSAGARLEDATTQLSAVQSFTFRPDGGDGDGDVRPGPRLLARRGFDLSATVSTALPTGTRLALVAAVNRSDTNFTPREYEGTWHAELTQSLLEGFGRTVNLVEVRRAGNSRVAAEWQLRQAVLEVVAAVEVAYWELALAQEVVDIRRFAVRIATEQLDLNRDLVDTGRAVRSAVLSAEAEVASRRADLAAAEGAVRALSASLQRLLDPSGLGGPAVFAAVDEPALEPVDVDVAGSVQRGLEHRPELHRDRVGVANRRLDVLAARDLMKPSLDLSAGYGRSSLGPDLGDAGDHLVDDSPFDRWWLGVVLDVPLSGRGDRARLERAGLAERQAEAVVRDTTARVVEEVRRAAIDVGTQRARIEATAEAVRARREELRVERDRYQVGMARNLDVLLVQRLLIQAEVDAAAARVDHRQAVTELLRAEGTLLEHRGILVSDAD